MSPVALRIAETGQSHLLNILTGIRQSGHGRPCNQGSLTVHKPLMPAAGPAPQGEF
jgi:hypothetical protein